MEDHQNWKEVIVSKKKKVSRPNMSISNEEKKLLSDEPELPKKIEFTLSKRIQQGRANKNMTQKELARQLNIKPQVIQSYENGSVIPDKNILNKIFRILNL